MSLKYMKAIMHSKLPSTHRYVALIIADFANDSTGECWPAVESIIQLTGLGRRTVCGCIADLKKLAVLTTRKDDEKGTVYKVHIKELNAKSASKICKAPLAKSASKICIEPLQDLQTLHIGNPQEPEKEPITHAKTPPEITEIAERFAACRMKDAGLQRVAKQAVEFYSNLLQSILKNGEVTIADLEQVVTWFETPEGMESFHYGVGNMDKGYSHILSRKLSMYLSRAKGKSPAPRYGQPKEYGLEFAPYVPREQRPDYDPTEKAPPPRKRMFPAPDELFPETPETEIPFD